MEQSTRVKRVKVPLQPLEVYQFSALVSVREMLPDTEEEVTQLTLEMVKGLGLSVLQRSAFRFTPSGFTVVFVLSQSHLVLHTWPEYRSVHVDLVISIALRKTEVLRVIRQVFAKFGIEEFHLKSGRVKPHG